MLKSIKKIKYAGRTLKYAFFIFIAALAFLVLAQGKPLFVSEVGQYTFYIGKTNSNAEMVFVPAPLASERMRTLNNVRGQSLFLSNKYDGYSYAQNLIDSYNCKTCFCECGDGYVSHYYYSPLISGWVTLGGKRVNLHVVISNSGITVGSPIIFGGY